MIEAMRKLLEYLEAPVFKQNTVKMIVSPLSALFSTSHVL
jgi:hypothetical protein